MNIASAIELVRTVDVGVPLTDELFAALDTVCAAADRYCWIREFPSDPYNFGRRYWGDELDTVIDAEMDEERHVATLRAKLGEAVTHRAALPDSAGSRISNAVGVESQAQGAPICPQCRGLKYVGIPGDACQYCEGSGRDKYAHPEVAPEPPADDLTAQINALPQPLRHFVMELETMADPAGMVRENIMLRDRDANLQAALEAQSGEIARQVAEQCNGYAMRTQIAEHERDAARATIAEQAKVIAADGRLLEAIPQHVFGRPEVRRLTEASNAARAALTPVGDHA